MLRPMAQSTTALSLWTASLVSTLRAIGTELRSSSRGCGGWQKTSCHHILTSSCGESDCQLLYQSKLPLPSADIATHSILSKPNQSTILHPSINHNLYYSLDLSFFSSSFSFIKYHITFPCFDISFIQPVSLICFCVHRISIQFSFINNLFVPVK